MKLPAYHRAVLIFYVFLVPFLYAVRPEAFRYDASLENTGLVILTLAIAFTGLFIVIRLDPRAHWPAFRPLQIPLAIGYGLLFAVPEEIFFRGVIQGAVQEYAGSVAMAVLLSSAAFGIAHIFNHAGGLRPRDWNWKLVGFTFLAGMPLGLLFALTGSLLFSTALHVTFLVFMQLFYT